jgi:hypothetical protein
VCSRACLESDMVPVEGRTRKQAADLDFVTDSRLFACVAAMVFVLIKGLHTIGSLPIDT